MNTSLRFFIPCLFLTIVGCTTPPKHNIVYTNDSVVEWRKLKLTECADQSIMITLSVFDTRQQSGQGMTKEEVIVLQKWLSDECAKFYKLDI